jgi:hypothetical protein
MLMLRWSWLVKTGAILAFAGFLSLPVRSTTVVHLSVGSMTELADLVFAGTVVHQESRWDTTRSTIWTYVTLTNLATVKGESTVDTVTLAFKGGTVDGHTISVAGMPRFREGQREILLVHSRVGWQPTSAVVGMFQGRFQVRQSPGAGSEYVVDSYGRTIVGVEGKELVVLGAREAETSGVELLSATLTPGDGLSDSPSEEDSPEQYEPEVILPPSKDIDSEPWQSRIPPEGVGDTPEAITLNPVSGSQPIVIPPENDPGTRLTEDDFLRILRRLIE